MTSSVTSLSGAMMQAPQPYQGVPPTLPSSNDTVVGGNMSFNPYNVKLGATN